MSWADDDDGCYVDEAHYQQCEAVRRARAASAITFVVLLLVGSVVCAVLKLGGCI